MSDFPKPGDICELCRPRWEAKKLPLKRLVGLPAPTLQKDFITVCPYCDGDPIIRFANKANNKKIEEE